MEASQISPMDFGAIGDSRRLLARRSHLEIQMDVLKVIHDGARAPTQIMYKANLAWVALQSNLKSLIEGGFLTRSQVGSKKRYELTEKGLAVLGTYLKVIDTIEVALAPRPTVR